MHTLPHYLADYATPTRACFAIVDDFGNLVPCAPQTYFFIVPHVQVQIRWI